MSAALPEPPRPAAMRARPVVAIIAASARHPRCDSGAGAGVGAGASSKRVGGGPFCNPHAYRHRLTAAAFRSTSHLPREPSEVTALQFGASSQRRRPPDLAAEGGLHSPSPRAHGASMQYTWTRPCLLHHPTHPFAQMLRRVQLQRTGPGHNPPPAQYPSSNCSTRPPNSIHYARGYRGSANFGYCTLWCGAQPEKVPPAATPFLMHLRPGKNGGNDTTIKATAGESRGVRNNQPTNGDICSGWPKFGFHICSLRSQLPVVNRYSSLAASI